jgi:V8-like Glu-specific endopeptidase
MRSLLLTPLVALAFGCSERPIDLHPSEPSDQPSAQAGAIVNGQVETGYPGVGALVTRAGNRYYGSFCTATLIAPQWLLTAAHCIKGQDLQQQGVEPSTTFFFVGADARAPLNGLPEGTLYAIAAFVPHPYYDPDSNSNDIGLVYLAEPVTDVEAYNYNATDLADWVEDRDEGQVLTIGFGATEGRRSTGSGLKRSTRVDIDQVVNDFFTSRFVDTGTCFGDSGGPSYLDFQGNSKIIGVTSAGAGCPMSNPDCDPCTTLTYYTRVDRYSTWISQTLDGPVPTCNNTPNMCLCAEACGEDGKCDTSVICKIASCQETYFCIRQCNGDAGCIENCRASAPEDELAESDALVACADERCAGLRGDERRQCLQENCPEELAACFDYGELATGDDSCAEVYGCFSECTNNYCFTSCLEGGTAEAQQQVSALDRCLRNNCEEPNVMALDACARIECRESYEGCFPPTYGVWDCAFADDCRLGCNPADDTCSDQCHDLGTAEVQPVYQALLLCLGRNCFGLTGESEKACRERHCAAENAACRPPVPSAEGEGCSVDKPCAEGLDCVETSEGVSTCEAPCVDADGDGACLPEDCDDGSLAVSPDLAEVCDNDIDDDCDGSIDELETCPASPEVEVPTVTGGCHGASGGIAALALLLIFRGLRRRTAPCHPGR